MNPSKKIISGIRIKRIQEQGYTCQTNQEISNLAFGNRFAFQLCTTLLIIGVATTNIPILIAMLAVAISSIFLPYHLFDYIYNHLLSKRMNLPKLQPRSPQLKFACSMATLFIGATISLLINNYMLAAYIVGSSLIVVAVLVSTIDFCIPSIIYNKVMRIVKSNKLDTVLNESK